MNALNLAICGIFLCLLQLPTNAQNENAAKERLIEFSKSRKPFVEIHDILSLKGGDKISAEDLKSVLKSHGDDLLRGDSSKDKFLSLSAFCEIIMHSSEREKIVPELIKATSDLKAPTSKLSELHDWDKIMIRGRGDRIGLLMNCILEISGKEGFEMMFNQFEKEGQRAKITILLEQTSPRKDREQLFDFLSKKLKEQKNLELKEEIQAFINRSRSKP